MKPASGSTPPRPANFVRLFKAQFAILVEDGEKLQTIRPTPKRLPKPGDHISLRTWTGQPYRSKQRILRESTITRVSPILIKAGAVQPQIYLDGTRLTRTQRPAFAQADGFPTPEALAQWFHHHHTLPFTGIVIWWRP